MSKKPFTHLDRDTNVRCSNPKCAHVNGIEGVVRQPIKKNVLARLPEGTTTVLCYYCAIWTKTGLTKREAKKIRDKRRKSRDEKNWAEIKSMTAETT